MATALAATGETLDDRLTAYFASEPDAIADPYPLFRELRETSPVYRFGARFVLTRYEDVKAVLSDPERIRTSARREGSLFDDVRNRFAPEYRPIFEEVIAWEDLILWARDGEEHYRRRTDAHRAFTPRRIAELGQAAQRYVDEMLDAAAGDDVVDLREIAFQVPLSVILDLLDVPKEDRALIREWSEKIGRNKETGAALVQPLLEAHEAITQFRAYVEAVIEEHRVRPRSNLVSALVGGEAQQRLTPDEVSAMYVLLLFAGHETTSSLLGTGTLELLRRRAQWEALCADPGLAPAAVEELVRHVTPVQFTFRLAAVDVELGGATIPAGTAICHLNAAANRDPAVFDEPDEIDFGRANAKDHLGFGYGPHYCLGQALARLEGRVFFETVARRFPDMELAADTFTWTGNAAFRGLASLPVALGRDRGR